MKKSHPCFDLLYSLMTSEFVDELNEDIVSNFGKTSDDLSKIYEVSIEDANMIKTLFDSINSDSDGYINFLHIDWDSIQERLIKYLDAESRLILLEDINS
jgi:hypothetical protein